MFNAAKSRPNARQKTSLLQRSNISIAARQTQASAPAERYVYKQVATCVIIHRLCGRRLRVKENDVQLIHRTLSGDDEAFSILVKKYRKRVHTFAWRQVGDFHFAEEVTQDIFLQVHKKLSTLRNPKQFSGWLYVIAYRLCNNWHRSNKTAAMQLLEHTNHAEVDEFSYRSYELEARETEAVERRREVVKVLLRKLPESERTVVMLYYLSEMTTKEIGNFLGVSVNTIKSRLQRARKRLWGKKELLSNEIFKQTQLSTNRLI